MKDLPGTAANPPNIGKKSENTEQKKEEVSKSVSMELRSPRGVSRYSSHRGSEGCGESHRGESLPDTHGHHDAKIERTRGNTHDSLHPQGLKIFPSWQLRFFSSARDERHALKLDVMNTLSSQLASWWCKRKFRPLILGQVQIP